MKQIQVHPTDAELLEYLDGELTSGRAYDVERHVGECDECRRNVASFSESTSQIEEFLNDLGSPQVPTPQLAVVSPPTQRVKWPAATSLRAALVLLTLGAATLVVSPVRAWVVDLFMSAIQHNTIPPAPSVVRAAEDIPQNVASVGFVPSGPVFELSVARLQSSGVLAILVSDDQHVRGSIVDQQSSDELVVLGAGLRIVNTTQSTSSYEIRIPSSVTTLTIRVPNRETIRLSHDTLVNTGRLMVSLDTGTIQ